MIPRIRLTLLILIGSFFAGLPVGLPAAEKFSQEAFLQAIVEGNSKAVDDYLAVHPAEDPGRNPDSLWGRALVRVLDMYKLMMEEGEDIRFNEDPDETEAWIQSVGNYLDIFDQLIKPVENSRRRERYQAKLFESAILEGNPEIVALLIERGYPPEVQDDSGNTPLMYAAGKGNIEVLRLLIRHGASIHRASLTETPFMRAVARDRPDTVRFLANQGAEVNGRVNGGETALFLVVREGNSRMLDLLLGFKVDINAETRFGWTPLMEASIQGQTETARRLLAEGADPNREDALGRTALMLAAGARYPELVTLLLEAGADVDARAADGQTALMHAVRRPANEAVIRRLILAGAQTQVPDAEGRTPLSLARSSGNAHYTGLLLSAGTAP